jgi:hypothetical protein
MKASIHVNKRWVGSFVPFYNKQTNKKIGTWNLSKKIINKKYFHSTTLLLQASNYVTIFFYHEHKILPLT